MDSIGKTVRVPSGVTEKEYLMSEPVLHRDEQVAEVVEGKVCLRCATHHQNGCVQPLPVGQVSQEALTFAGLLPAMYQFGKAFARRPEVYTPTIVE